MDKQGKGNIIGHIKYDFENQTETFTPNPDFMNNENKPQDVHDTNVRNMDNKSDLGICKEKNCKEPATTDYNGHQHYVCAYHDKKLSDYFDEEYR